MATPEWAALTGHVETSVTGPPTACNKRVRVRCPAGSALGCTGFSALEGNRLLVAEKGSGRFLRLQDALPSDFHTEDVRKPGWTMGFASYYIDEICCDFRIE